MALAVPTFQSCVAFLGKSCPAPPGHLEPDRSCPSDTVVDFGAHSAGGRPPIIRCPLCRRRCSFPNRFCRGLRRKAPLQSLQLTHLPWGVDLSLRRSAVPIGFIEVHWYFSEQGPQIATSENAMRSGCCYYCLLSPSQPPASSPHPNGFLVASEAQPGKKHYADQMSRFRGSQPLRFRLWRAPGIQCGCQRHQTTLLVEVPSRNCRSSSRLESRPQEKKRPYADLRHLDAFSPDGNSLRDDFTG